MRDTGALQMVAWRAIWKPGRRSRRSASTRAMVSCEDVWGGHLGRELRSWRPALPSARHRASHLKMLRLEREKAEETSATGSWTSIAGGASSARLSSGQPARRWEFIGDGVARVVW